MMIKLKNVLTVGLLFSFGLVAFDAFSEFPDKKPENIVFSGHSLTDVAVPTIVDLAKSKGHSLNHIYQSIPGSPIRVRSRGDNIEDETLWDGYAYGLPDGVNLVSEFRNPKQLPKGQKYDTLVITERHDLLSTIQYEATINYLRHFHDRLLDGAPNAVTYLYSSWLDINKAEPAVWVDYESDVLMTWQCVASKVNLTLADDNLPANVKVLPANWAMAKMVDSALKGEIDGLSGNSSSILDKIFSDNVHLTPLGSLFIGAFSYSQLYGQSPEGFSIPRGVSRKTGKALLSFAWQLANEYHESDLDSAPSMSACRTHIKEKICEPFWDYFLNEPGFVNSCKTFFGGENSGNPFRKSTPDLVLWPAP